MAARPRHVRIATAALVLLVWLFYWSQRVTGAEHALGVLVATLLVSSLANQVSPVPWAARWSNPRALGSALVLTSCLLLAAGLLFRAQGLDPPFMDRDQVLPLSWWAAAAFFVAGTWRLLGELEVGPACAACGEPARGPRCPRCGATLAAH